MKNVIIDNPLVSVIIPNFNCLRYLPKAIGSIHQQGIDALEVLVVDDHSTDGSKTWLRYEASRHKHFRLLNSDRVGPAAARNLAIKRARGRYIAFLDADDIWLPGKLNKQVKFLESNPDIVFSFSNYRQVDELTNFISDGFEVWSTFNSKLKSVPEYQILENAFPLLFCENPIGTSTVLVRRSALLKTSLFDETLPSAEDIDLWLRLAQLGGVACTRAIQAEYLIRSGSESSHFLKRMSALNILNKRYATLAKKHNSRALSLFKSRIACAYAQKMRSELQYQQAIKQHLKAFVYSPSKQHFKALMVDLARVVSL